MFLGKCMTRMHEVDDGMEATVQRLHASDTYSERIKLPVWKKHSTVLIANASICTHIRNEKEVLFFIDWHLVYVIEWPVR